MSLRMAWGFATLLLTAGSLTVVSGCGGDVSTGQPVNPTITSVSVSCSPASILANQTSTCTQNVSGTGVYSSTVTWSVSPTSMGTISSAGIFTPAGAGTATITATSTQDSTKSGTVTVTVSAVAAATPTFSVAAGTYTSAQAVTISDATAGAVIYYTTNGTTPTTSSTMYAGAISVSSTETLEAMATATGYTNSAIATAAYTINIQPNIASIQPNPASVGTSVTITGANFGATQGGSTVTFNGTTASAATWSATSITVPVPTGATTGNVVVTVSGQPSNGYLFTVTAPAPIITSIQPNPASVGTTVTITGANFGATQGGSTVTFNGTTASPATWSATSITAPVPVGATTGNVVVTVSGQPSSGYSFTVAVPAQNITNIQPNPAAVGTSVTITGTNFGATQGGSTVTFNGTTASPVSWSATSITTLVPVGATTGNVIVTVGGQASNGFAFEVSGGTMPGDAITWRYDNSRDGVNPNETTLTTSNVNSTTFGKVGEFTVNGRIDGEVLYLGQISISGQMKNVIYFATENDMVYAVDADSISGSTATVLWSVSLVPSGEAPAVPNQTGATCDNISPTGVKGTPVIDRGRNAIYVVAKTMNSTTNTTQFFRLHALNLTNGAELFGGPATVSATYPGTAGHVSGGIVTFSPRDQSNRPGLLETGSNIYLAFGGQFGDCGEYSGFLMSYDADTLAQSGVIDLNPNSIQGGMWNSGAGPSADVAGSIYVSTANTGDDLSIGPNDYPNSVVRLTNFGTLAVADFFTPDNAESLDEEDLDLGSTGVLIMPDLVDSQSVVHRYAVAAGKDGNMYVVDRDNMGQFSMSRNNTVQTIVINGSGAASFNYSTPAYFNNNVYVCPSGQTLKAFAISNALLATSATMSTTPAIGTSGFTISANGTSNGIVWAIQPTNGHGVLYAFDASNLSTMLYASNQAAANRDQTAQILGNFHTPTVAKGRVYFGTGSTVAVFGVLP